MAVTGQHQRVGQEFLDDVQNRPITRKREPEVPLSKRPEPPQVTDLNWLIEAQVDTDLLDGVRRHVGVQEPRGWIPRGEVHHEEDDRGDADDEGNGAEKPPHDECSHRPPLKAQL